MGKMTAKKKTKHHKRLWRQCELKRQAVEKAVEKVEEERITTEKAERERLARKAERDNVLAAVQEDGTALYYATEELRNDREIVCAAVRECGWAIEFASLELQKDAEVVNLSAIWAKAYDDERLAGILSRRYASPELSDELQRLYGHWADF